MKMPTPVAMNFFGVNSSSGIWPNQQNKPRHSRKIVYECINLYPNKKSFPGAGLTSVINVSC
jgi:hypothetical protein